MLEEACPGIDFENETDLVDDEVLDSLDIITIIQNMIFTFDVEIDVEDIEPENFNSFETIYELLESKL